MSYHYGQRRGRYRYPLHHVHPDFQKAAAALMHDEATSPKFYCRLARVAWADDHSYVSKSPRMVAELSNLAQAIGYRGEIFGKECERTQSARVQ